MSFWRRLVREAHRRSLWQVLGVYILGAWVGYQVVLALFEGLALPEWVPPLAIVLFVIGLPIVLATAMVQEGPPTRETFALRRESDPTLLPGYATNIAGDDIAEPAPLRRHLTWRRSLAGGVAAFALLAMSASGFVVVRNRGTLMAQGVFDRSDIVVLADFATRSAAHDMAATVTEALRIDLQQSGVLRLADPGQINSTLARMQRDSIDQLPVTIAREVAEREGWKAVLAGEIGVIGGSYVLTAQLLTPDSGRALASFKSTASDSTALLNAVDELSKQVRAKVGESLRDVRAAPPLERVSTSSLPALRRYAEATRVYERTGDQLRAVELLEQAVTLDSAFAMSWRRMGLFLNNLGIRTARRNEALTRAYELRGRLSNVEALLAEAAYEQIVKANRQGAMAAYERALEIDSINEVALNNLAVSMSALERHDEAAALAQRALDAGYANEFLFNNLIAAQYRLGHTDAAAATLERAKAALPDNLSIARTELRLAAANQQWAAADSLIAERIGRAGANVTASVFALGDRADIAYLHGRVSDALRYARDLERTIAPDSELRVQQRAVAMWIVSMGLTMTGDTAAAVRALDDIYRRFPPDSFPVPQSGALGFAEAYAEAGRHARAAELVERAFARAAAEGREIDANGKTRARIALLMGDPQPVLETHNRISQAGVCKICDLPRLGKAYELAGHADSARIAYDDFLTLPHFGRLNTDPWNRPELLLRSAELHAAMGNNDIAIERYTEFVRLWEKADPQFQPRVEAAKAAIVRLRGPG